MPVVSDYFARVSLGRVDGHQQYLKYAVNTNIDTGTPEDILSQGGDVQILSAQQTCEIVSDNANDTSGGTGCQIVSVQGVDGNLNIVEELVTMNGLTPVTLTNQYIAIWRMRNIKAGDNRINIGFITVTSEDDTLLGQMDAFQGASLTSLMIVPMGYRMLIYDVFVNIGVTAGSSVSRKGLITIRTLDYDNNAEVVQAPIGVRDTYSIAESFRLPLQLGEGNFIWFRADRVEQNATDIEISYTFELIKI